MDSRSITPAKVWMFFVPFPTHRTVCDTVCGDLRCLFRGPLLIQSSVKEKVEVVASRYVSGLIDLTLTTS